MNKGKINFLSVLILIVSLIFVFTIIYLGMEKILLGKMIIAICGGIGVKMLFNIFFERK
ncbi:hypothetical protein [Bacillus cereus]|uniref:hypothetical protein n=1 Tax=Bacillus cereus TaxID=1396 RepID=UPI000279D4EA|nr:hypothetical protein [Bacillus cereus]EJR93338.1 hypothetical protein IKG_05522 [Bacillus cereus VD200]